MVAVIIVVVVILVVVSFLICLFQVEKLQRASLMDPVKLEVNTKYQTVEKLQQYYIFIPVKYKVRFQAFSMILLYMFSKI